MTPPSPDGSRVDYLVECLKRWPASHALVRAVECRKLVRHPLPPPVLDVGCGDGAFARLLFEGPLAAGIDVDRHDVQRAHHAGSYAVTACASATRLPFGASRFASVFSNCVLEHVDDLDAALAEIHRVLRPGGVLLSTVPTPRWETDGPFPVLRRLGFHGISDALGDVLRRQWHHVTVEDHDAWRGRLARAGLTLRAWEPYMVPLAYAAFARNLPFSIVALVTRRLTGRWIVSARLRALTAPIVAARLRRAYVAEDSVGTCALYVAERVT